MKILMILMMTAVLAMGTLTLAASSNKANSCVQYCYDDYGSCQVDCYWDCEVDGHCNTNQCRQECDDELDYCLSGC